jgi:trigger factor
VTLPDLSGLQVERPRTVVDDDMVERRLRGLLDRLAEVEPVDREVRAGDVVVADLDVLVDGAAVPSEARRATEVELVEGTVVPELLEALQGERVGDVVTTDITLPEEHPDPDLQGKPARLQVTIQGLKEKRVPELTDAIAHDLSEGRHATADAMREGVREELIEQARRLDELTFEQAAVRAVVEASQVEVPEALVERELDRRLDEAERSLQRRGLRVDRYLQYVGKTEVEYRDELRPEAHARARVDLVLEELARTMEISPSQEEVGEHIRAEAERDDEVARERDNLLHNPVAIEYFRHRLTRVKLLEALVERLGGHGASPDSAEAPGSEKAS